MTSDIFDEIINQTLFGSTIFKDETKLFREYVPERLQRREKELKRISRDFKPIIQEKNFPVNILISGKAGAGKTVLAKYFCEKLINFTKSNKKNLEYYYCNAYTYRSKSAILYHLLSKLYNTKSRGFEPEILLVELANNLKRDNKTLILILDEVHVLKDDIRFFLQFTEPRIHYILISRERDHKGILNIDLSGKITDHIKMDGYTKDDLFEILEFRIKQAFKLGAVPNDIINMIADIASSTQNARHALEIAYHAGKIADCNNEKIVTSEYVRKAKNYIFPETTSNVLKALNKSELLVLLAVARSLFTKDRADLTIKEAYSYFRIICEEFNFKRIRSQNTFTKKIKRLIDLGLIIHVKKRNRSSRKRISRITLHDVSAQILEQQLTTLLRKKNKK